MPSVAQLESTMKHSKELYSVHRKSHEITHTTLVSNRFVGRISEVELSGFIGDDRLRVFVNAMGDDLELVSPETHRRLFDEQWSGHITDSDDFDLDDFVDGYCFIAEHWKGREGRPVVILYCHH